MAKSQRGKTAPSLKTADVEEQTEDFCLMLPSSDDEAPEEVTFEDSKAEAVRSLKQALESARREKELLKEKRRKRQELFQEQKKRKLLPVDVLEEIDSAPSKKQKQSEDEAEEEQPEVEEDAKKEKKKKKVKLAPVRNLREHYTVKTVNEQSLASVQQKAAEDFIKSRLYGPGNCRTTNKLFQLEPKGCELRQKFKKNEEGNELLSLQNKKGRNQSAAVQFVRKDWACKEKTKAEKLKKRWIHKRQVPPC